MCAVFYCTQEEVIETAGALMSGLVGMPIANGVTHATAVEIEFSESTVL